MSVFTTCMHAYNSECREVREKAEEESGSEVNKSEGDSAVKSENAC
jgi:hypothetical protein